MRARGRILAVAATLALFGVSADASLAGGPTPGVVTQTTLDARDLARMARGGVETLRLPFPWSGVEPAPGSFYFDYFDGLARAAAVNGIELLPIVYGSPPWLSENESEPPIHTREARRGWRRFLAVAIERYGRGGELWRGPGPAAPITRWQIWNEPNFALYWHGRPSPEEYATLSRISAAELRAHDRRARILLAGIAPIEDGVPWWTFLRRLYEIPGFRRSYDAIALHPYSPTIDDLRTQLALARRIMVRNGDRRTPLALTEVGWSSDDGPAPLQVGRRQQAALLRRAFALAGERRWRITDVQWYAWEDATAVEPLCSFCENTGLFDLSGRPKPAWRSYKTAARQTGLS